ncbi:MAG: HupE/UreJ family protein [SAR86 cluster bacterium]|uniref:HupE/UreJ family protein n=1 Tax=SAR86 cluster bacterium TaxID=2030880 RepID=A0A520N5R0_9GAMM|nr:MAG: HupE/UreJ family protein [SAR86 cluster bacterium]
MRLLCSLFFLISLDINSHEFNPAHLVIEELTEDLSYEAIWMYPYKNIGRRAEVIFPNECVSESNDLYYQGKYINEKIFLECSLPLKGLSIEIVNLSVLTDALITINFKNNTFEGLVNVQNNILKIPLESNYYPYSYLELGFSHLFDGLDHILFIFGLLFCISGFINIIKTITAFTIAHSITLGLTVFELISLPQGTTEALIALTIVYLASEINQNKRSTKTPWIMAFGFGLLHGLGFAGALIDIGIPNNKMLLSLFFFNAGIELAQIALIPIPLLLIFLANKYNSPNTLKIFASYSIGGLGFYWFIDRVIGIIL